MDNLIFICLFVFVIGGSYTQSTESSSSEASTAVPPNPCDDLPDKSLLPVKRPYPNDQGNQCFFEEPGKTLSKAFTSIPSSSKEYRFSRAEGRKYCESLGSRLPILKGDITMRKAVGDVLKSDIYTLILGMTVTDVKPVVIKVKWDDNSDEEIKVGDFLGTALPTKEQIGRDEFFVIISTHDGKLQSIEKIKFDSLIDDGKSRLFCQYEKAATITTLPATAPGPATVPSPATVHGPTAAPDPATAPDPTTIPGSQPPPVDTSQQPPPTTSATIIAINVKLVLIALIASLAAKM